MDSKAVEELLERLSSANKDYAKLGAKLCLYAEDLATYSKQIEKLKEENEKLASAFMNGSEKVGELEDLLREALEWSDAVHRGMEGGMCFSREHCAVCGLARRIEKVLKE